MVLFIGEYLPSLKGGAEKSILQVLARLQQQTGTPVRAYVFDSLYPTGHFSIPLSDSSDHHQPVGISGYNFGIRFSLGWSRFWRQELNRSFVRRCLQTIDFTDCEYVVIQTLIAPMVGSFLQLSGIPFHYYIRDEVQLNIFANYERGWRFFLKCFKSFLEFPATRYYRKENIHCLRAAQTIVVNSRFASAELRRRFDLPSNVQYPVVDTQTLRRVAFSPAEQRYITYIGGPYGAKGFDIVLRIAKRLPQYQFLLIGFGKKRVKKRNMIFLPWQSDIRHVYRQTRLLLVPSRWHEFFGRVVVEAEALGIPVISSDRGGLPEAHSQPDRIIADIENTDQWVQKIKSVLLG